VVVGEVRGHARVVRAPLHVHRVGPDLKSVVRIGFRAGEHFVHPAVRQKLRAVRQLAVLHEQVRDPHPVGRRRQEAAIRDDIALKAVQAHGAALRAQRPPELLTEVVREVPAGGAVDDHAGELRVGVVVGEGRARFFRQLERKHRAVDIASLHQLHALRVRLGALATLAERQFQAGGVVQHLAHRDLPARVAFPLVDVLLDRVVQAPDIAVSQCEAGDDSVQCLHPGMGADRRALVKSFHELRVADLALVIDHEGLRFPLHCVGRGNGDGLGIDGGRLVRAGRGEERLGDAPVHQDHGVVPGLGLAERGLVGLIAPAPPEMEVLRLHLVDPVHPGLDFLGRHLRIRPLLGGSDADGQHHGGRNAMSRFHKEVSFHLSPASNRLGRRESSQSVASAPVRTITMSALGMI